MAPKETPEKKLDIVSLGETMIRHYTRHFERIEQSRDLGFSIAGAESNVVIAAARVGLKTGWISKLVENPLGEKIHREIELNGVDMSRVVWTDKGRVGTFYIEFGSTPRPTKVIYDREGSAASTLKPEEVDWDYVRSAKWFHTTGITPALSKACLDTVRVGIEEAHRGKTSVSLDLNYRSKLWSPSKCKKTLSPLLPKVDLFIAGFEDLIQVFGIRGTAKSQAKEIQEEFGVSKVLVTCGAEGAILRESNGEIHEISFERFPVKSIDRIGTGDAFAAGFLAGMIERDIELGLLYGAGLCALKYSIPGDHALVYRDELLAVIEGKQGSLHR
ncbi:MAG: sugar kinase [Candidatus Omnitrophica bacterium]|nr:sugar kinase [Candidatus Omnitrophota bacterium]